MGKVLCFIYDKMADFEVALACHLLEKEVVPIAYKYKNIESESGLSYYPKLTVK